MYFKQLGNLNYDHQNELFTFLLLESQQIWLIELVNLVIIIIIGKGRQYWKFSFLRVTFLGSYWNSLEFPFQGSTINPATIIIGTISPIPIQNDKRKLLYTSSNYWAIALSSIFGKILDGIILIQE